MPAYPEGILIPTVVLDFCFHKPDAEGKTILCNVIEDVQLGERGLMIVTNKKGAEQVIAAMRASGDEVSAKTMEMALAQERKVNSFGGDSRVVQ